VAPAESERATTRTEWRIRMPVSGCMRRGGCSRTWRWRSLMARTVFPTSRCERHGIRDGAWVAEVTGMLDLTAWPEGSQVILRTERPHPGAQLRFTDADGHRITAVITDIPDRIISGQTAGRELEPPSACPGGRPDPRGQEHGFTQPSLPWVGGECRVAGNAAGGYGSGVLGQNLPTEKAGDVAAQRGHGIGQPERSTRSLA
jgi:hypothetical protein